MIMTPHPELPQSQRDALLSSAGPARLKHFIGFVADCERLWGLRNASGWVAVADETGVPGFPVWPHPDYATACVKHAFSDSLPAEIDVHEFTEEWLPDMAAQEVLVAVFPTPLMKGVWMEPEELQRHLAEELKKYD